MVRAGFEEVGKVSWLRQECFLTQWSGSVLGSSKPSACGPNSYYCDSQRKFETRQMPSLHG